MSHMKTNIKLILLHLVVICFSLASCKTETIEIDVDYSAPSIKTGNSIKQGDNTFILNATISKLNDIDVIEHGFIIQKRINVDEAGKEEKIIINEKAIVGDFSINFKPNDVVKGDQFRYFYYLKTLHGYYKGQYSSIIVDQLTLPFKSTKATIGEKVTIEGDFSMLNDTHILLVEKNLSPVPYTLSTDKKELSMQINDIKDAYHGNVIDFAIKSRLDPIIISPKRIFSVEILGKLNEIPSKTYNYADELFISTLGLSKTGHPNFYILINDYKIPYKSVIKFSDIPNFNLERFKIGYMNGRDSIWLKEEHYFKKPRPDQISSNKSIIHPFTTFSIIGYSFEFFKTEHHYLGNYPLEDYSKHFDLYTYRINDIPDGKYNYRYQSEVNKIELPKPIEVVALKVDNPNKNDYYMGEKLLLKGTFLKNERYLVGFSDSHLNQVFTCINNGELITENLAFTKGEVKMRVGYESNNGNYFNNYFTINNLGYTIDDFTPKKGHSGQLITITGKGVHHVNSITVAGKTFDYNIQREHNLIKFIIPTTTPKGKFTIGLKMSSNDYFEFNEKFELL